MSIMIKTLTDQFIEAKNVADYARMTEIVMIAEANGLTAALTAALEA